MGLALKAVLKRVFSVIRLKIANWETVFIEYQSYLSLKSISTNQIQAL